MKNKITYGEILYYEYFKRIIEGVEYKKASKENDINSLDYINKKLDNLIEEYGLNADYFDEAKEYYERYVSDIDYLTLVEKETTKKGYFNGKYYEQSIGNLCYDFFNGKNEYFEPSIYDNCGDLVSSCINESNIHVYLPMIKPYVFLNLLKYDNKIIIEKNLSFEKCNSIFVGLDESEDKIEYSKYSFLNKYNFISPSNITKESFNVALGLERLSDYGIMMYNTHALNMYKNDSKSYLFRKYLIDNKLLKAVIFTKSYTRKVDYEVTYVITKNQNEKVVFIDAGSNQYRNFYEINPFSDEYDFGNDFMNISRIVNNYISSYGISSVVAYENIINKDYKFDLDEYIITDKSNKRRPLEEIEMDIRIVYEKMEQNLY